MKIQIFIANTGTEFQIALENSRSTIHYMDQFFEKGINVLGIPESALSSVHIWRDLSLTSKFPKYKNATDP